MSTLKWIAGAALAGWGIKTVMGGSKPVTVRSKEFVGMTEILGRPTYIHAPANAKRTLVYFHGFGNSASMRGPRLAAAMANPDVALIVPQLGPKSEPGDLDTRMVQYLSAVANKIGLSGAYIDGVSHSGGYRALAAMLRQVQVSGVGLLDSLYGAYETFLTAPFFCMINIYGSETATLSEALRKDVGGDPRFQITYTSTLHDQMPEMYLGKLARAFPHCAKVLVTP